MCGDRSSSTAPLLYRRKSPGLTTNTSGPSSALKAVCSFGPPTYWEFGTNCRRTCASLFWFHWVTSRSNHSFWAALAPRGAKNCQKLSAALERSLVSGPHPGSAAAAAVAPSPLSTARRDGCEGLDDGGGGLTRGPPLGLGLLRGDLRGESVPALLQVGEHPGMERGEVVILGGVGLQVEQLRQLPEVRAGEPVHMQLPATAAHGVQVPVAEEVQ